MKLSRVNKIIAGIMIIFIGFGLLFENFGLIDFDPFKLFPLIVLYFGMRLYSKNRKIIGGLLSIWGALLILGMWFNIHFDDIFGVLVSLAIVYFGFRLIRAKKPEFPLDPPSDSSESNQPFQTEKVETNFNNLKKSEPAVVSKPQPLPEPEPVKQIPNMRIQTPNHVPSVKESRSSLIGDFHLTSGRFELKNLNIWHGVGDVIIDLSRALIQEEEAFLVINGWVGGITIYVPVDLPVSVAAEVTVGDMEVFGHRQGGVNRHVVLTAEQYDVAPRKVKIIVSLIVGDIDVKYI